MSSLSVKFAAVLQLLFSVKKEFRVIVFEKYIKLPISFHAIGLFLYPLRTSENLDLFRGMFKRPVTRDSLTHLPPHSPEPREIGGSHVFPRNVLVL